MVRLCRMSSVFSSVFSNEEIDYLLQLPEVLAAKQRLGSSGKIYFTIPLTDTIRLALQSRFNLDLSAVSEIPMRWIKGDTEAHMDRGSRSFENTYLVYLQDSEGEFVLGPDSYPITANTGFVFEEGTLHKTQNTGTEPRLLLGPMNEFAGPVGAAVAINYYQSYYDANAGTGFGSSNFIASDTSFVLGTNATVNPYTKWRIAKIINSIGTDVTAVATTDAEPEFVNGDDLATLVGAEDGGYGWIYHVYPSSKVIYYSNSTDALLRNDSGSSILAYGDSYTLGSSLLYGASITPYTSWLIAFVTNNNAPYPTSTYANTIDIATATSAAIVDETTQMYYVYPATVCFKEGTQILCLVDEKETYVPIEIMRAGTLVKTSRDGYKKVELIGKNGIVNPGHSDRVEARLYKLSPSNYPELKDDLYITGGHSVLVETITDKEREDLIAHLGNIFVTDQKYRLTAMVDERAEPWASAGEYTIWHFALEHEDIKMNYGVYANGLLVETCSINAMRTKSNLSIV